MHTAVYGDRLDRDKRVRHERVYYLRDLPGAVEPADQHAGGELLARILAARKRPSALDQS